VLQVLSSEHNADAANFKEFKCPTTRWSYVRRYEIKLAEPGRESKMRGAAAKDNNPQPNLCDGQCLFKDRWRRRKPCSRAEGREGRNDGGDLRARTEELSAGIA